MKCKGGQHRGCSSMSRLPCASEQGESMLDTNCLSPVH